jgi:hypothetical protein
MLDWKSGEHGQTPDGYYQIRFLVDKKDDHGNVIYAKRKVDKDRTSMTKQKVKMTMYAHHLALLRTSYETLVEGSYYSGGREKVKWDVSHICVTVLVTIQIILHMNPTQLIWIKSDTAWNAVLMNLNVL